MRQANLLTLGRPRPPAALRQNRCMAATTSPSANPSSSVQAASAPVAVFGMPAALVRPSAVSQAPIAITLTTAAPAPEPSWKSGTVWIAGFALLGVLITVKAAHMRMRSELNAAAARARAERELSREEARLDREHAASEAHNERIATTRREVYLQSVESFAQAQAFIASLATQDLTRLDVQSRLRPLAESVNKISVVGETETVRVARDIVRAVNQRFINALGELLPLAGYRAALDVHQKEWDAAQTEIQRLLAAMRHHNESVVKDPATFEALQRSFQGEQQRGARANAAAHSLRLKLAEIQQSYGLRTLEYLDGVALQLDPLVDCMRRELGLATDFEAFRAQTLEMLKAFRAAHQDLQSRIAEVMPIDATGGP